MCIFSCQMSEEQSRFTMSAGSETDLNCIGHSLDLFWMFSLRTLILGWILCVYPKLKSFPESKWFLSKWCAFMSSCCCDDVGPALQSDWSRLWFCLFSLFLISRLDSLMCPSICRVRFKVMKAVLGSFVRESWERCSNTINASGFHVNSFVYRHTQCLFGFTAGQTDDSFFHFHLFTLSQCRLHSTVFLCSFLFYLRLLFKCTLYSDFQFF